MKIATVVRRQDEGISPHHMGATFFVVEIRQNEWLTGRMEFAYMDDAITAAENCGADVVVKQFGIS